MNCTRPAAPGRSSTATATCAGWRPPRHRPTPRRRPRRARRPPRSAPPRRRSATSARRLDAVAALAHAARARASRLGAGLVEVPPVPFRDPSEAVLGEPRWSPRAGGSARAATSRSAADATVRRDGPSGFCRKCGTPFSFEPKLGAGDLVGGQYEVVGCIAHGGMGWIYLAKDRNVSDRWVVLKGLLNTGDDDAMAAALAERRFLAEVEHPNIVKIFNFVQHESSGYIVMEYVGGRSLKQILTARREANGGEPDPLPPAQAIAYMLEILPALGYLHEHGAAVLRLQDRQRDPDAALAEADRPRRRATGSTIRRRRRVRHGRLPGARDRLRGPVDRRPTCSRSRARWPCCASTSAATRARTSSRSPRRRRCRCSRASTRCTGSCSKGTAPEPGRPLPVGRGDGRPALRRAARGRRRPRRGTRCRRPASCSPARCAAARAGPTGARCRARRSAGDDPGAGYLATITATDPQQLLAQLSAAPEQTRRGPSCGIAATLIELGDWDGVEAAARRDRGGRSRGNGASSWYRGLAELARERPGDARAQLSRRCTEALPGELAPKLALGMACELAGEHADAARLVRRSCRAPIPAFTARHVRARALPARDRRPRGSARGLRPGTGLLERLRRGADRPDPVPRRARRTAPIPTRRRSAAAPARSSSRSRRRRAAGPAAGRGARGRARARPAAGAAAARNGRASLLGHRFLERDLRLRASSAPTGARSAAAAASSERIQLVDRANQVRPRTWT